MCTPLLIGVAGLGVSIFGAVESAHAQDKASAANRAAALAAARQDEKALGLQETQVQDAAAVSIAQAHRQALNADAQARVSAGASGVAGASVQAILGDISAQESAFKTQTERNTDATIRQIQQEKVGSYVGAANRIAQVQPSNPLATGLQIASAGLDFATNQIKINRVPPAGA